MVEPAEPTDDELVSFAESLLKNVGSHLRAHHVLVDAIAQHRDTWLTLYHASQALHGPRPTDAPGLDPSGPRTA